MMVDKDQSHHHRRQDLVDKWNKYSTNVWQEVHQELVHYSQAMMVIENHRLLIWWQWREFRFENWNQDHLHEFPSRLMQWHFWLIVFDLKHSEELIRIFSNRDWGTKDYLLKRLDQIHLWRYPEMDFHHHKELSNNGKQHDNERYWNGRPENERENHERERNEEFLLQDKHQKYIHIVHYYWKIHCFD